MHVSYRFRQSITGLIILSLTALPPPIVATGYPVFDLANWEQNMLIAARELKSNLNEAQALYNQVQQIAGQAQQIKMEVQNITNYPISLYNQAKYDIEFMRQLADSSASLGTKLSEMSARFSSRYPGYRPPSDYQNEYLTWTNQSLGAIKDSLDTVNKQMHGWNYEEQRIDQMRDQSAAAVGQLQVMQSANQVSLEVVRQLQQLRQLQAAEMAVQNSYLAGQIQEKADEKAIIKKWLDDSKNYKSIM